MSCFKLLKGTDSSVYLILFLLFTLVGYPAAAQQSPSGNLSAELPPAGAYSPSQLDTESIKKQFGLALSLLDKYPDSSKVLFADLVRKNIVLKQYQKVGSAFTGIAMCYSRQGDYDKSIYYYRSALQYAPYYKDKSKLAFLYSYVGDPWFRKGVYDSVAVYAYKATEILREIPINNHEDASLAILLYSNLGTLWNQIHKPGNAIEYFRRAEVLSLKYGDSVLLTRIYTGLGSGFAQQNKGDSALKYYKIGILLNRERQNPEQVTLLASLGQLYLVQNKPELAIPQFEKAIELNKLFGDPIKTIACYFVLGGAYYDIEEEKKAEEVLLEAFRMADAAHYPDKVMQANAAGELAKIYESTGDYRKAYAWQQRSSALFDSTAAEERLQATEELEKAALKAEKNNEIAQKQLMILSKDVQLKEKNYLIFIISAVIAFLIILLFSFYRSNKHKQKLQSEQIHTLNQEHEIGKLRAMLKGEEKERARIARELHDGVASQLASVKLNLDNLRKREERIIHSNEVDNAYLQLEEATIELRKTAHNLMPDIIIDSGLEIALKVFCDKVQQASKIGVDFEVFGQLPRLQSDIELSIYRMIQELIQNVLKHAQASHILIQLVYQDRLLSITIEDDGQGYNLTADQQGAGLKNISERVNMLNGSMEVNSRKEEGTTVYLEFDIFQLLKQNLQG